MKNQNCSTHFQPGKIIRTIITLAVLAVVFILPFSGNAQQEQDEPLVEEVQVTNISIPFKVFKKKKQVGGLQKEDFTLLVNGQKRPINGFFETRKKIGAPPPEQLTGVNTAPKAPPAHRFFVFIFNITDFESSKLQRHVDILFEKILRPTDHYMVITNNYFIGETIMKNPAKEKKSILDVIHMECAKDKKTLIKLEMQLRLIIDDMFLRMKSPLEGARIILRDFFVDYKLLLDDMRRHFYEASWEHYIRVARKLKEQKGEKWILSFYQIGRLPEFASKRTLQKMVGGIIDLDAPFQRNWTVNPPWLHLEDIDDGMIKNISKLFVDSGATMHTLLMNPPYRAVAEHFTYKKVAMNSESILRKVARMTGGSVARYMKIDRFIENIVEKEDIGYMLTYVPQKGDKKGYRLAYDNQHKPRYFKRLVNQVNGKDSPVEIESIVFAGDMLRVVVSGMKIIPDSQKNKSGEIEARIIVMDKDSKLLWEVEKKFTGKSDRGVFMVTTPPHLPGGNYNVLVEVNDTHSWKSDAAGKSIKIAARQKKAGDK
ncbi:MAG: hypothetical protein GY765_01110 [bacterium]|nr:hypothetical protein [bacterium]